MSTTRIALSCALMTLIGATVVVPLNADASGRSRHRQITANADGGYTATAGAAAVGQYGGRHRGHTWRSDGQGNVAGHSSGYATSTNGGSASRYGSFYRNSDGSAGREGSASVSGTDGGAISTSGGFSRSADGSWSGQRDSSLTGRNGSTYQGSTSYASGTLTHTSTCTNAAGEVVACRGR